MPTGYCTVEDVRRALQEADLSGALAEDNEQLVVDAITGLQEWLEKTTKRHWYEPNGLEEDTHGIIPTGPKTRDDEESITTRAPISGMPAEPKTAQGSYTKIVLARRDAEAVQELLIRTEDGSFEDWTSTYSGGTWPDAVGDAFYLRVNNGGWSRLYLDTENLYDEEEEEWLLDSFANAVYVTYDYGHEGIPMTVRRAVAMKAAAQLLAPDDEATLQIPDNASLQTVETKVSALERQAEELLEVYL